MSDFGIPTIILCGGRGSRMGDVSRVVPKPMLLIGDRPVLWHIMKIYASHGHRDFVLALGWLGDEIRRFFLHYEALTCDFRIELGRPDTLELLNRHPEDGWRVSCVDTGRDVATATRVRLAARHVDGDTIMVTYGDGVGDVDVKGLLDFHHRTGKLATITAVHPPGRFGELMLAGDQVAEFVEKPQTSTGAISGGFMVFERTAIDRYIPDDRDVMLEREPLAKLAADGQLAAYQHMGFWQPMDTPREQQLLSDLWQAGTAPWKQWDDGD